MLYKGNDLSRVSIKEYLTELSTMIIDGFDGVADRIELSLDVESIPILLDVAVPLGIVLNELMTNSLKYAFPAPRKGRISIVMRRAEGGGFRLEYADDGVGVPADFNLRAQRSLGIRLIYDLSEGQLHGKAILEGAGGFRCAIAFPESRGTARI
jgi:two-component sensor histidine kinase